MQTLIISSMGYNSVKLHSSSNMVYSGCFGVYAWSIILIFANIGVTKNEQITTKTLQQ